jgi:hypothetical protein
VRSTPDLSAASRSPPVETPVTKAPPQCQSLSHIRDTPQSQKRSFIKTGRPVRPRLVETQHCGASGNLARLINVSHLRSSQQEGTQPLMSLGRQYGEYRHRSVFS